MRDLHAAYADGLAPAAVCARSTGASRAHDDAGIFISLVPEERGCARGAGARARSTRRKAALGHPLRGQGQHRRRRACRPRPPARTSPTCRAPTRAGGRAAARGRRASSSARPISTSSRPASSASRSPYRRAAQPVRRGASCPAARAPARRSRWRAGLVAFALGTDTAGSGRVPAALNNIVGLKPTLGAVPTRGVVPACRTLDCVSVFALTVADAFAALRVMAGFDADDPFSTPVAVDALGAPAAGGAHRRARTAASRALLRRRRCGGGLRRRARATSPRLGFARDRGRPRALPRGRRPPLRRPLGRGALRRRSAASSRRRPEALHPVTRAHHRDGARAARPPTPSPGCIGSRSCGARREPTGRASTCCASRPSRARARSPISTPTRSAPTPSSAPTPTSSTCSTCCALAVPGRFRAGRLSGRRHAGRAGRPRRLPRRARAELHAPRRGCRSARPDAPQPSPPARPSRAPDGEIELAVVGAHLSGMPLNRELTGRGGALPARGADDARLPALRARRRPAAPARPAARRATGRGLRSTPRSGRSSPEAFGAFVAAIPAPLGIGTLRLADGTRPKGFLVEAEGIAGAEDISRFGGWRAYLATRGRRASGGVISCSPGRGCAGSDRSGFPSACR